MYVVTLITQDEAHSPMLQEQFLEDSHDEALQRAIALVKEQAENEELGLEPVSEIQNELCEPNGRYLSQGDTPFAVFITQH